MRQLHLGATFRAVLVTLLELLEPTLMTRDMVAPGTVRLLGTLVTNDTLTKFTVLLVFANNVRAVATVNNTHLILTPFVFTFVVLRNVRFQSVEQLVPLTAAKNVRHGVEHGRKLNFARFEVLKCSLKLLVVHDWQHRLQLRQVIHGRVEANALSCWWLRNFR